MFTGFSLNVHWMFTENTLKVHWMFTVPPVGCGERPLRPYGARVSQRTRTPPPPRELTRAVVHKSQAIDLVSSAVENETLKGGLRWQSPRWAAGRNRSPVAIFLCRSVRASLGSDGQERLLPLTRLSRGYIISSNFKVNDIFNNILRTVKKLQDWNEKQSYRSIEAPPWVHDKQLTIYVSFIPQRNFDSHPPDCASMSSHVSICGNYVRTVKLQVPVQ
jgi:hypothetical protein